MAEQRPNLSDPGVLDALAHPVRLDVLGYLMSTGAATASQCARAVGDTPSNCSYHLRVLASHGLVEPAPDQADGRSRPWRATLTGFSSELGDDPEARAGLDAMEDASLRLDYQLAREHVRNRQALPVEWRDAESHATYGLRMTPAEFHDVLAQIDAIVRPYVAPTREDVPDGAGHVHLATLAFPRTWGQDPETVS